MPRTPRASKRSRLAIGVSDHGGWAVLLTVAGDGAVRDRRRIELVDAGLPPMPHHHEAQRLPPKDGVALVARVQASAERNARAHLAALAESVGVSDAVLALRVCPPLPPTVAERIADYRAMCVADWVMYRQALAAAADARGWAVAWYDAKRVTEDAAALVAPRSLDVLLRQAGAALGPPWQKDHRLAMAAALAAHGGR